MNQRHLELWAQRAVKELQEYRDAAVEAGSEVRSTRLLIDEYAALVEDRSDWMIELARNERLDNDDASLS